jgi:hypothetical protein
MRCPPLASSIKDNPLVHDRFLTEADIGTGANQDRSLQTGKPALCDERARLEHRRSLSREFELANIIAEVGGFAHHATKVRL